MNKFVDDFLKGASLLIFVSVIVLAYIVPIALLVNHAANTGSWIFGALGVLWLFVCTGLLNAVLERIM